MSSDATTVVAPSSSSTAPSVIVIGAGWYGIAAAKTYLQFNPAISLTVLDADSSIGGTWGSSRIYPGLVADSPAGLFEYSDMSMSEELGIDEWGDIDAATVAQYLERYADKFGVLQRCRFNTTVTKVDREAGVWKVHVRSKGATMQEEVLSCDKLVVATGVTNNPRMPNIDSSSFKGKVLHSKDVGPWKEFLTSDAVSNVTVVGGNKSALEAVRLCAYAGKEVTWLIRKDGRGPGILFTTRTNGRHRAADGASRWTSIFRPGIYARRRWLHNFLYSGNNRLGTWLQEWFWKFVTKTAIKAKMSKNEFRKLLNPEVENFFWPTSGVSFLHDSDEPLMKLVEEGKRVHIMRENIVSVNGSYVYLTNNQAIESDAVVYATGWKPSHNSLFDERTSAELGLPIPVDRQMPAEASYWQRAEAAADQMVLKLYPILRKAPFSPPPSTMTPWRLFRTIAPTKLAAARDYSLAFVGLVSNNQVANHAEISGLWAVAYLEGKLTNGLVGSVLDDKLRMDTDVAEMTTFMARRYLGRKGVPDAAMEIQDYTDVMMRDMGLRVDRKRLNTEAGFLGLRAWKAEWFSPYMPKDYRGVVQEFLNVCRDKEKRG